MEYINDNCYVIQADSIAELAALEISSINQDREMARTNFHPQWARRKGLKWLGVETIDGVKKLTERGWPEGLAKAESILDANRLTVPKMKTVKRKRRRGAFGDSIDIHRVNNGDLNRAWEYRKREAGMPRKGDHVILASNIGATVNVTSEQMFWRGAVTTIAADMIERSGRSVKIIGYSWSEGVYPRSPVHSCKTILKVKDYSDSLDMESVITMLGLAGFFRYYVFKSRLSAPFKASNGLGTTVHRVPQEVVDKNAVVIDITDVWNENGAQQFLNSLESRLVVKEGVAA